MAQDPASIDCLPLKIEVTWDVDERVMRWDGKMDQAKFTLIEDYGVYLLLLYDSGKRKKLTSCMINGPSPEAEEFINANFVKVQGCILGCKGPSSNCREYDIPAQELVVTVIKAAIVDEDGFVQCGFGASWDERGDVCNAGLHTSHLSLDSKQIIPKGYYVRPGLHVVETGNFDLKASGKNALSYDDFAKLWEVGEIVKYFSEKYPSPGSFGGHKTDQNLRLAWPDFEFRECVECYLLPEIGEGKSKIAPYQQAFRSKSFMAFISGNMLPIRDGAMVKKDWKEFGTSCTITLKKVD